MLINFLADVVIHMESFKNDIQTIYVERENDKIIAAGNHSEMQLLYRVIPNIDLTEHLQAPAYLGALGYLRSLLGSDFMKEGHVEVEYKERDGTKYASSMRFRAPNLDANFECTYPGVIKQNEKKTKFEKLKDGISFPFTKIMRKEFDEVARMNTPKSDDKLFTLVFDGHYVRAIFGEGKHTTTLIMTDQVSGNKEAKIQKKVFLDRFRPMIRLAAENNGQASFHEKAFWVDFQTPHAFHTIATPTKRDQLK